MQTRCFFSRTGFYVIFLGRMSSLYSLFSCMKSLSNLSTSTRLIQRVIDLSCLCAALIPPGSRSRWEKCPFLTEASGKKKRKKLSGNLKPKGQLTKIPSMVGKMLNSYSLILFWPFIYSFYFIFQMFIRFLRFISRYFYTITALTNIISFWFEQLQTCFKTFLSIQIEKVLFQ